MYALHKLIAYLVIVLIVFGVLNLVHFIEKKRQPADLPLYDASYKEFLPIGVISSFGIGTIVYAFFIITLYTSCFDENRQVLTEKSVDTYNIYSLSDVSELSISGHYNKAFVLASGDISSSNQISYKYYSEDRVNGKKVKKINVLSTEGNNIYFNDTLKDSDKATLEVITTETIAGFVWSEKAMNSKLRCWLFKHENAYSPIGLSPTETKIEYIFNIPENSVIYEYKLDTI